MGPKALQQRVEESLGDSSTDAHITFKPMFGGILGYCDGKPFASLSDIGLAFKLGGNHQAELLKIEGAEMLRYEPNAPASKQYVVLPAGIVSDNSELAKWLDRSVEHVRAAKGKK